MEDGRSASRKPPTNAKTEPRRRRRWPLLVAAGISVATAAVVGIVVLTRPPEMRIRGAVAFDRDRALLLTEHDARAWAVMVHATRGPLWQTELPAPAVILLGHAAVSRGDGLITIGLEGPDAAITPPTARVIALEEHTGRLRWEAGLDAGFESATHQPVAVGRYDVFPGEVAATDASKSPTEGRLLVIERATGALAFRICHVTSTAECAVRVPLGHGDDFEAFAGTLLVRSTFASIVDLEARAVLASHRYVRDVCRDGEDLIIVRHDGIVRRHAGVDTLLNEPIPDPGGPLALNHLVRCGRIAEGFVWVRVDTPDGEGLVFATDPGLSRVLWRVSLPPDAIAMGTDLHMPPASASGTRPRYVPMGLQIYGGAGDEGRPNEQRWLALDGRISAPFIRKSDGVERHADAWIWASPTRVLAGPMLFDTGVGALVENFEGTSFGVQWVTEGRLWLFGSERARAAELPWVALEADSLEVAGAGSDWRPRSMLAFHEERDGPFPTADAQFGD